MKKIIILPFIFLAIFSWGQAQFIVQNGTKTEVYNNINTAIENAASGDTLYLPGGGFTITPNTIDKTLHWVGHGHYPSETGATMPTRITTALTFTGNCDNSSFEGIWFTSSLTFGSSTDEALNIKLKRCRVSNNIAMRTISTGTPDLFFTISECVLYGIDAKLGKSCLVEKSLIYYYVSNFVQGQFSHNYFIVKSYASGSIMSGISSCLFTNNVFGLDHGIGNSTASTFNNNVFAGAIPYDGLNNYGQDNVENVGSTNIFTDLSQSSNTYTFSYENDYTLVNNWLSSDGTTVVGIYGTTTPYKTIPYYPHINTANIATEVANGELGVNINAQAQSR